jgi:GNAT superfamily N-acetyltransferase
VDDLARQRAATYRFWREDVSCRPGGAWAQLGTVQVHTTGLQPRHWNGACLTAPMDLDAVLPDVAAWFAARDKPWGLLIPAELDVQPTGLEHALDQGVMLRTLTDLPDVDPLPVREDAPPEHVALVQAEAFGDGYDVTLAFVTPTLQPDRRPPQTTVTTYDGDAPIGCATVAFVDGVAGVFGVAVREAWRRRGIGAALTAQCLQLAAAAGCDLAYLNPSPMAHATYTRLGFRDALPFRIWVPT